jgi:hypothetical protein
MILSSSPLWWLALPVLLLPVWWHRQKRQRLKAEALATARFLPAAPPEQLRVWQWRDKLLLLVRCLLLVMLIAWLAATIFPWRGDTVLVDVGVDKSWAEKEVAVAGFASATRIDMPPAPLQWLRQNERDWRADAKLLIIARAGQVAMPARLPQFSHQVTLRTQPASLPAKPAPTQHHVALSAEPARQSAWHALFAAFDSAGNATSRHTLAADPDASTALIIWDTPKTVPAASWHAANWWISTSAAAKFTELASATTLSINGVTLQYADSPRGRLWTSNAFPPRDVDTASALYEAWQLLATAPAPAYATPSQSFTAARALPAIIDAKPASWLAIALLALFILERSLTHARRN